MTGHLVIPASCFASFIYTKEGESKGHCINSCTLAPEEDRLDIVGKGKN